MTTREQVLKILKEVKPTKNLENISDIIEGGYIDSFELMALITSIMDGFGVEISFEDITPDNFNSVEAIVAMIERLAHQE